MIDRNYIDKRNEGNAPGVVGIVSIGGYPGNYTLRAGITGPKIASGTRAEIVEALNHLLTDPTA